MLNPTGKSGLEISGDYLQLAIPLSAAIYSAIISDWQGMGQMAKSYVSTFAATEILKRTVREDRPTSETKNRSGDSFPSGHTSNAFAGAGYWQMRYGWWVGAPMYAAASLVAYSRVDAHAHYWWDVVAGAAIGIGFNMYFTERYNSGTTNLAVTPMPGGAYLSVGAKF